MSTPSHPHFQGTRQRCPELLALLSWGIEDRRLGDGAEVLPGESPGARCPSRSGRRVFLIQSCASKWALGKCLLNLSWEKEDRI